MKFKITVLSYQINVRTADKFIVCEFKLMISNDENNHEVFQHHNIVCGSDAEFKTLAECLSIIKSSYEGMLRPVVNDVEIVLSEGVVDEQLKSFSCSMCDDIIKPVPENPVIEYALIEHLWNKHGIQVEDWDDLRADYFDELVAGDE